MTADKELMDDIVNEAEDDWIDLFHAVALVKVVEGGEGRMNLLGRAGPLVVQLVRDGRLVAGDLGPRGTLSAWSMTASDAAQFVQEYVDQALSGVGPFIPWDIAFGQRGAQQIVYR